MPSPTKLSLLPYLQAWDGNRLCLRLLVIPLGSPLDPLIAGLTPPSPSFATADFVFEVRLVQGLAGMATTGSPAKRIIVPQGAAPQREPLLKELAKLFPIDPTPPPPNPRPAGTQIRKY